MASATRGDMLQRAAIFWSRRRRMTGVPHSLAARCCSAQVPAGNTNSTQVSTDDTLTQPRGDSHCLTPC
jgi:hypothetical protein